MKIVGKYLGTREFQSEKMSTPVRTASVEGVNVSLPPGVDVPAAVGEEVEVEVVQNLNYRREMEFLALSARRPVAPKV